MFQMSGTIGKVLMVLVIFLISLLTTQLSKYIAFHINAIDIPNERKVHKKPMPRLGGIGIFLAFTFGYVLFGTISIQMNSILIASFLLILIGICDDIKPVKATYKLLVQIVSACVLIFYGNIYLNNFSIFGIQIVLNWIGYPVTIIFIIGIINAINLIDGLDGLSSGTCLIFYVTSLIIALLKGVYTDLSLCLILIMIGSTLGFWVHNFYPAKIFAGDTGSMFMGFMIAVISLLGFKTTALTSVVVPILILAIPILDTLCAILRRIIQRKPIFLPDKNHLHHQLLKMGLSHRNTVLAIYLMNILFATASIIYITGNVIAGKYIYISIFILVVWIVTRTSIIKDHNEKK